MGKHMELYDPNIGLFPHYVKIVDNYNNGSIKAIFPNWLDEAFNMYGVDNGVRDIPEDDSLQRYHINNYWRLKLGMLKTDTFHARSCLINAGTFEHSLTLFRDEVLPCLEKNLIGQHS